METVNNRLNELVWAKTVLMRQEFRGEIKKEEYDIKLKEITDELIPLQQETVKSLVDKNIEKYKQMEENKMAEEKVVKEKKVKVASESKPKAPRKYKENTKTSFIVKALQMKSIKSMDKAVEQIKTWSPDSDEKKLKSCIAGVIRAVKIKKGRWASFTWDEENFTLTPKV